MDTKICKKYFKLCVFYIISLSLERFLSYLQKRPFLLPLKVSLSVSPYCPMPYSIHFPSWLYYNLDIFHLGSQGQRAWTKISSFFQIRLQVKRSVARQNAGKISFSDRDVDDVGDGYVACEPYQDSHVWEHVDAMERAMQVCALDMICDFF